MAIIANWKIRSRARKCAHTGHPFQDGDRFHTCIVADPESDGYLRKDYSEAAWEELKPHEQDPEPFSYWRSTFEVPVPAAPDQARKMDKDDAEVLLHQLMEADDPRTDKTRYILIVMLERKKLLKQVGEKQVEDRRLLIYEHTKTGEVFIVTDPQIRLDEVQVVQEEVVGLLDEMAAAGTGEEDEFEPRDEDEGEAIETGGGDEEEEATAPQSEAEPDSEPESEPELEMTEA